MAYVVRHFSDLHGYTLTVMLFKGTTDLRISQPRIELSGGDRPREYFDHAFPTVSGKATGA